MAEKESDRQWLNLLQLLISSDLDFIVVGGAAMSLHGIPRATLDIDIFIEAKQESIESIYDLLTKTGQLVCQQKSMAELAKTAHLLVGQWMTFSLPDGPDIIDIYFENAAKFRSMMGAASQLKISGSDIYVASIDQLKKMKLECNRAIDQADIALLDEFSEITRDLKK